MWILETLPVPFPVLLKQWECCLRQRPAINTAMCLCAQSVYIVSAAMTRRNGNLRNFRERSDNNKQYHKNKQSYADNFFFFLFTEALGFHTLSKKATDFIKTNKQWQKKEHILLNFFFFGLWVFCRHVCLTFDDSEPFIKKEKINKLVSGNYPLLLDTVLCFPSLNFFSPPSWENIISPQHPACTIPALSCF